jgi:hypothetical protein
MSTQYSLVTLKPKLKKLPEVKWGTPLNYGEVYRVVGAVHIPREPDGSGLPFHAVQFTVVAGRYCGQMRGNPDRHWFEDSDGTRYLVSSPAFTMGFTLARVYHFRVRRKRASVAA